MPGSLENLRFEREPGADQERPMIVKKVLEAIRAALSALAECKATGQRAESIRDHLKACESNAAAEVAESEPSKEPKKKEGGFARAGVLVVVGAVMALGLVLARADSFRPTNTVNNAIAITGYPTNSPGTNGLNQGTGTYIEVKNNEWCGFYMSGYATAASAIKPVLARCPKDTPAVYQYDATGTNIIGLNWETLTNAVTLPTVYVEAGPFLHCTNLDRQILGGANYVGLSQVTNIQASGVVTNFDAGLNKKIIPIRYP